MNEKLLIYVVVYLLELSISDQQGADRIPIASLLADESHQIYASLIHV